MWWSIVAYFLAPLGVLVWLLQMSGVQFLETSAGAVIGLKVSVGGIRLSLPMLIAGLSLVAWIYETMHLQNQHGIIQPTAAPVLGIETDKLLMARWRAERNWWILNFNLLTWITNWRVNAIVTNLREKRD
eukprot:gb/GFBE01036309.1/.p1 GENE.gb/GFBE01036309.1/~~gb/GFBE01036309.1/.p1  ORF type:complete len:130 (+),score=24.75 gb/GFBE01036309.1/:1-390(+)